MTRSTTKKEYPVEPNVKKMTRRHKPNQSLLVSGMCAGDVYML
jgi:hypothetical protein